MNKKGKYILLSIVILIVALFGIYLFTGDKEPNEKQTRKNIEDFKFLLVKVLVMDKEGTPNDLKTDEIFKESKYLKDILYSSQQNLLLTEENDGYVLDLNNSVNNEILKNATDYTFAMNNNNGETIKDCKVENNKVIIPKTYYKGKLLEPVQMEMITRLSKKELRNLPVKVSINNMVTTTKTVSLMGESNVTNLSLFKGGKNSVKKSNIAVYVNSYDSESKIDNAFYELQSKTGNLTLKTPPIFLNKLIVKVNANIFTKIANMAIMDVEALWSTGTGSPNKIELSDAPNSAIQAGKWYKTNDADVLYGDQMNDDTRNDLYYAWVFNENRYPQTDGNNTISKSVWWTWIQNNTPQNNTSNWSWSDYFAEDTNDSPSTGHNVAYASLPGKFFGLKQNGNSGDMGDYIQEYSLGINEEELDGDWDKLISMSCVHVGETIAIPNGSKIPMWAYVFYRKDASAGSDGEMDVLLTTDESLTTQTIFGIVRYTWPGGNEEGKGYIRVSKTWNPELDNDDHNATFIAWKANNGKCTANSYANNLKYESVWYPSGNAYLIGYHLSNQFVNTDDYETPGLDFGIWCVAERSTGVSKEYDYIPKFSTKNGVFTYNGNKIRYTKLRLSTANKKNSKNYYYNETAATNSSACLRIKKVDSETGKTIKGIKFKLYRYTGDSTNEDNIKRAVLKKAKYLELGEGEDVTNVVRYHNGINDDNYLHSGFYTDDNGIITFDNIKEGSYYAVELGAQSGTKGEDYWSGELSTDTIYKISTDSSFPYNCKTTKLENDKVENYYCIKIKKVDKNNPNTLLPGASFRLTGNGVDLTHQDIWDGPEADGIISFLLTEKNGNYTLSETKAPDGGYSKITSISVPEEKIAELNSTLKKNQAKTECQKTDGKDKNGNLISTMAIIAENEKYVLNWHKVNEKDENVDNAKFKVSKGTQFVKVSATQTSVTIGNTTKNCYVFDSLVSEASASQIQETNGEVCISGIPSGSYHVNEIRPADGHTYNSGTLNEKDLPASTTFASKSNTNTFINQPTYFEFEKTVKNEDIFEDLTTNELKKIKFNIHDSNNKKLCFAKNSDGIYEYKGVSTNDTCPTGQEKDLYLDDIRKIKVYRLPYGTYSIKEVGATIKEDGKCGCDGEDCTGYYSPKNDAGTVFTINECSNVGSCSSITNIENEKQCKNPVSTSNKCTSETIAKKTMENTPTMLEFTKSDLYSYEDEKDVVDFENSQERSDFDRIRFRLRKSKPTTLNPTYDETHRDEIYYKLLPVGKHGTCLDDDSYMEYRFVPDDMLQYLSQEQRDSMTDDLYTCGGHIRITHLCRGKSYFIEEISVPEGSVFTLPETVDTKIKEHKIECCDETTPDKPSDTVIINDKGTRVRFEKRDSKYNYLIPDENTTFEVYRCPKNTTCNLNDYITFDSSSNRYKVNLPSNSNIKLIKFASRRVITNDEEDTEDAEGITGVEVYNAMSDSDAQTNTTKCTSNGQNNCYVTDLNPYHGILVFRYLQSGYNYILLETKAPKNYRLPSIEKAQTSFTVKTKLSEVEISDVANAPTSILIRKYDDNNNLLPGAQFKVYDTGTKCDATKSPMAQKENASQMNFKTIRDGIYESRPALDTDIIQTCNDLNGTCSSIPINVDTKVVYDGYSNEEGYEWTGLTDATTENGDRLEIKQGEALIQYLEYGHCYVIEEVKAPTGYSLPEKVEDRFTTIEIPENSRYAYDTYKTFINTPTPFTFYKYDEFGNPLDGAKFKLQKLDDDKKYRDLTVTKEEKNGEFYYKVDSNSTNKTIETKDGKATVYYLESGQYRILETSPAPGKQLGKNANVATFFVDDSGNVYGNSIIVNKGETSYIEIKGSSSAEYIISPRTGVKVVKYGLIIAVLVAIISGLMLLIKKMNKEEK